MSWFKKHFPTFHRTPTLLARRVPAWTHVPAFLVVLVMGFALAYNVNELANLRHAVVEQERLDALTTPYGSPVGRSLVFGDSVCKGNLVVRFADWFKGESHCGARGGSPENLNMTDLGRWCNAWTRWYYGGAGCPPTQDR